MGYRQSKDRTISRGEVAILPVTMLGLSLYGVVSAFGISQPVGLVSWSVGIFIAGLFSIKSPLPTGISYSAKDRSYSVPGSWLPLLLMMVIFFIKYAVGVILARKLPIANGQFFIASVSLCYGLISGLFLIRALVIWRSPGGSDTASHLRLHAEADTARLRRI